MTVAMMTEHDDDKEPPDCKVCKGMGGYDASTDCEVYDDWQPCEACEGTGKEIEWNGFIPERDAFGPND
jgi:DnaJ-class molecular chaperone